MRSGCSYIRKHWLIGLVLFLGQSLHALPLGNPAESALFRRGSCAYPWAECWATRVLRRESWRALRASGRLQGC